jgi:hypothetical protein
MARDIPIVIRLPLPKPLKSLEKDPHGIGLILIQPRSRKKKRTRYPNKVFCPSIKDNFPDEENAGVSEILRSALLQSIATTLSELPQSSFPISPSIFYEVYILPYRSFKEVSATSTPVDIRHSGYKTLTPFLKASSKEGLIKLKESKGEIAVISAYHTDELLFFRSEPAQVSTNRILVLMGTPPT